MHPNRRAFLIGFCAASLLAAVGFGVERRDSHQLPSPLAELAEADDQSLDRISNRMQSMQQDLGYTIATSCLARAQFARVLLETDGSNAEVERHYASAFAQLAARSEHWARDSSMMVIGPIMEMERTRIDATLARFPSVREQTERLLQAERAKRTDAGRQKDGEPGATDNPDDAQRIREDH